jgi:hypothetical protein
VNAVVSPVAARAQASAEHGATVETTWDGLVETTIRRPAGWVARKAKSVRRGRPRKDVEHAEWLGTYLELSEEYNGNDAFGLDFPDARLNDIELSQLVVDKLGLTCTSRAAWDAIKKSAARSGVALPKP